MTRRGKTRAFKLLITRYRPRALPKAEETWDAWWKELGPSPALFDAVYGKGQPPIVGGVRAPLSRGDEGVDAAAEDRVAGAVGGARRAGDAALLQAVHRRESVPSDDSARRYFLQEVAELRR